MKCTLICSTQTIGASAFRTLKPFWWECCAPNPRAVMKMRLFQEMEDKFDWVWIYLSFKFHFASHAETLEWTKDLPPLMFFAHGRVLSFRHTGEPRLRCFFFVQRTWQSFIFYQAQSVRFATAWYRRLPLLEIKEWIWINNFLSVCWEMMCEKSMLSEVDR